MRHDDFSKRDPYLDYLRGIAILWVVVVHVFYHKQFVPSGSLGETFKALMLFEMPLLFFVSGASLHHSHHRPRPVSSFLFRRLRRLLYPYGMLAIVCGTLFYLREWVTGQPLTGEQVVSWLLLEPWPVVPVYVGFSMWFVRVMLAVTILHLILIRLFSSDRTRVPTAVLLVAGIAAFTPFEKPMFYNAVPWRQLPQYTLFYGAFMYLGYYYASGRLSWDPVRLVLAMVGSAVVLAALTASGFVYADAQLNKFPPNLGFLLFGDSWLALWMLLRVPITQVGELVSWVDRVLRFFSTHSYTVFLCHGFGFAAADFALPALGITGLLAGVHYTTQMVIYFAFALAFTIPVVALFDSVPGLARRVLIPARPAPRHASQLH